jgi:hypothetical protein
MFKVQVRYRDFCVIAITFVSLMAVLLGCGHKESAELQQKYDSTMQYASTVPDFYRAYQCAQNDAQRYATLERIAERMQSQDDWTNFLRTIGDDSYRFHDDRRLPELYRHVLINNPKFAPCWGAFQQVSDSLQMRHLPRMIQMAGQFADVQSIYTWARQRQLTGVMAQTMAIMLRSDKTRLDRMWLVQTLPPGSTEWEAAATEILQFHGIEDLLTKYIDAEPHYLAFVRAHRKSVDWVAVTATLINHQDPMYRMAIRELRRPRSFVDLVSDYTKASNTRNTDLQLQIADQIDSQPRTRKEWLDAISVAPGTYLHVLAEQRLRETISRPAEQASLSAHPRTQNGVEMVWQTFRPIHTYDVRVTPSDSSGCWGQIKAKYRAAASPVAVPLAPIDESSWGQIKASYR